MALKVTEKSNYYEAVNFLLLYRKTRFHGSASEVK